VIARWLFPLLAFVVPPRVQGAWGVAYAPADTSAPRPALVFLHGMWASPEDSCEPFVRAAAPFGFLVCPRGNAPLGDGTMWRGSYVDAERQVRSALAGAEALAPGKLDRGGPGTILGYSNGAYFAVEVACAEPGRWPGLIVMSMKLELDAARLAAAGVKRVVLAAGDRDGARASMQALAERLNGRGIAARFMSLGPVGHEFPSDMASRMCAAVAWVRGADETSCSEDPRPR
jgi:predicted esterase